MKTTELIELKNHMARFTWGKITEFFSIGDYDFAAYHPWKRDDCTVLTGKVDYDTVNYHIWIDGEDASISCSTLEEAMVCAIARKLHGINSQAGYFFMKMIAKD